MQMGEGAGHERVAGSDRIDDDDRGSPDVRCSQGSTRAGPLLTMRDDHEWNAGGMPVRYYLFPGAIRIQPGQILRAQLQDVDKGHPALETAQVRLTIWDQTRADVGIQAYRATSGFLP